MTRITTQGGESLSSHMHSGTKWDAMCTSQLYPVLHRGYLVFISVVDKYNILLQRNKLLNMLVILKSFQCLKDQHSLTDLVDYLCNWIQVRLHIWCHIN